jgi:Mannosyltransferase (PIG-V)
MSGMARDGIPLPAATRVVASRPRVAAPVALAEAARALVLSRLVVVAAAVGAVAIAGVSPRKADFDPAAVTRGFGWLGDLLAAPAARWDSVWYLAIARDGYPDATHTAFFPLYPLLVRAAGAVCGSLVAGGILVSLACALAALALLHRLTELELGLDAARGAVWALALSPVAFFLSAVYSESLFLALSVGGVYAARTRRWAWAGLLGALAAGTRSAGVLLAVPLVLLWWEQRPRRARDLAWVALIPVGLGAFCAWLAATGLDAGAPFHAQDQWFRHFAGPFAGAWDGTVAAWDGARQLLSGSRVPVFFTQAGGDPYVVASHNLELFAALLVAVPLLVGVVRRLPLAYAAYAVCALALPLSYPVGPQPLMSLPRFELVLFPLFMALGAWLAEGGALRRRLILGASTALLVLGTAAFSTWHWVA